MKAKVYVTLKPSVLDPQGKAIKHSVELLGYGGISDIRQGKYFEIAVDGSLGEAQARAEAERMAREVLSNPRFVDAMRECACLNRLKLDHATERRLENEQKTILQKCWSGIGCPGIPSRSYPYTGYTRSGR